MEYFKHYQKNFNELLKSSDDVDFRKKNFDHKKRPINSACKLQNISPRYTSID